MNYEKNLSGYSNLDDISKFVNESPVLLKQLGKYQDYTSKNYDEIFRRVHGINGLDLSGQRISDTFDIHHCFPQSIFNDGIGISFISRTKININDPRLIVWWEKSGHRQKATEYNNRVIELLNNATSDEEVIDGIRKIMNSYGFKVNF